MHSSRQNNHRRPARLSVSRALPNARGPALPPRTYRDAGTPHGSAAIRFVDYMLGLAAVLILLCSTFFQTVSPAHGEARKRFARIMSLLSTPNNKCSVSFRCFQLGGRSRRRNEWPSLLSLCNVQTYSFSEQTPRASKYICAPAVDCDSCARKVVPAQPVDATPSNQLIRQYFL